MIDQVCFRYHDDKVKNLVRLNLSLPDELAAEPPTFHRRYNETQMQRDQRLAQESQAFDRACHICVRNTFIRAYLHIINMESVVNSNIRLRMVEQMRMYAGQRLVEQRLITKNLVVCDESNNHYPHDIVVDVTYQMWNNASRSFRIALDIDHV